MSKYKTFLEVMAGPDGLRLNHSQKRVLRKVIDAVDSKVAAEQLAQAKDARNLVAAAKILSKYGYISTEPELLSDDDEPETIELTPKGQEAVEEYDIANDESLVTDDEREDSAPEGQPSVEPAPQAGAAEPGGEPDLMGQGVGLELSSFFREVNDLATLKESFSNNERSDAFKIIDSLYGRGHPFEYTVHRLIQVLNLSRQEALNFMMDWASEHGGADTFNDVFKKVWG